MHRIARAAQMGSRQSLRIPRSRIRRARGAAMLSVLMSTTGFVSQAWGQAATTQASTLNQPEMMFLGVAAFAGLVMAGVSSAYLVWSKNRFAAEKRKLEKALSDARKDADGAERLLHADTRC